MLQSILMIAGGVVAGVVVLIIEYHTKWFARSLTSSSKKQSRTKSSPKQLPSKKPDLTKGHRLVGIVARVAIILLILGIIIVGIIQVILPGGFGSRIVSPPPQQTIQQSEKPSTDYREHPSPLEMKDQILGQPLLQQKNTGDSFIGLKVQWYLKLFDISTTNSDPNMITLHLVEGSSIYPDVTCNIDIREYPEIKIAKKDIGVFVKGEISKAGPYSIELINCVLTLD